MNFDAATINMAYNLRENANEEYRTLFQNTDYEMIMSALAKRSCEWKRHPSTSKVTTFPMVSLR